MTRPNKRQRQENVRQISISEITCSRRDLPLLRRQNEKTKQKTKTMANKKDKDKDKNKKTKTI